MAQILVRNLDDTLVARLKMLASQKGISLEQEVREILNDATRRSREEVIAHMDMIRSRQPPQKSRAADLIREDRDR
jgi:plasmid stability protein